MYLIIGILVVLLAGLMFSPLILQVDTYKNQYLLRWGLGRVQFIPTGDDLMLRIGLGFWSHRFSLLRLLAKPPKKEQDPAAKPEKRKAGQNRKTWSLQRLMRLIRTFRVRYFRLDLDCDDFVTNAYLYPMFKALSTPTRLLTINFQGRNQCAFEVKNRIASVLIALFF